MNVIRKVNILRIIGLVVGWSFTLNAGNTLSHGPLVHRFRSTLNDGLRHEFFGPLLYSETYGTTRSWGIPFLFNRKEDSALPSDEWDFLYPFLGYDRFGEEYRVQVMQFLTLQGGRGNKDSMANRLALYPFYFHQRSTRPEDNYTAFMPFYGHMKNRFLRDEIDFVLWPLYIRTRKRDIITHNFAAPLFHHRQGDGLSGWQFWPLAGWEEKRPQSKTLLNGEQEIVGGHRRLNLLWPLFFRHHDGLGTDKPVKKIALVPFFSYASAPQRDSITVPWPIGLTLTRDREKGYREYGVPWPLVVWTDGNDRITRRLWPLYGTNRSELRRNDFFLWPAYRYRSSVNTAVRRERHQLFLYLYSHVEKREIESDKLLRQEWHLWPLFTAFSDHEGNRRCQLLAPLEPILPGNESVERNYAHAWALWRSETNGNTGITSQSLLWNLYRSDRTSQSRNVSLLFGLFQYQRNEETRRWKILFIPVGPRKATP
ncbi:MAG: hypothetical protein P8L18_04810 [Verrucomicrobiota bacterium]|nr:hypothetical protein [Verrucomicrobiota bacterium]MDG1890611.1 hypothetical protein [Verrucomicrobiota bacterium]